MLKDSEADFGQDITALIGIANKLTTKKISMDSAPLSDLKYNQKLREDSPSVFENTADLLHNTPETKDGYIFVPSIMEAEQK